MINTRLRDVGKCMNCRRGQRLSTCRRRKIYAPPRRAAAKSRFLLSRRRRHLAAGVLLHVILSSSPCVNAEQTARFRKWWMVRTQWSWVNSWKIANQIVSNRVFFVGQKPAYCNDFGWKKIDLLGITPNPPPLQRIWTKFGTRAQVRRRQRSGKFGRDRTSSSKIQYGASDKFRGAEFF